MEDFEVFMLSEERVKQVYFKLDSTKIHFFTAVSKWESGILRGMGREKHPKS